MACGKKKERPGTWEGEASAVGRSSHLGGRGSCRVDTSSSRPRMVLKALRTIMTGGSQIRLKGAHFGVGVGGRPVSGHGVCALGRARVQTVSKRRPWLVAPFNWLLGTFCKTFGVWVGVRPVSGLGTWEGYSSGHLGGRGFCRVQTSSLKGDCYLVRRSTAALVAPKGNEDAVTRHNVRGPPGDTVYMGL